MSQLDYVLQKQQQLTKRSAIKPADQPPQSMMQYSNNNFNVPHNFYGTVDPYLHERLQPPAVNSRVFFNPDFSRQTQNSMMHVVNPAAKTIHFNPNLLIQTNTNPQELYQIPRMGIDPITYNQQRIPSKVHVNPAVLNQSRIPIDVPHSNVPILQNEILNNWYFNQAVLNQQNITNSVPIHINPKFVAKPLVSETYRENNVLQQNSDFFRIQNVQNIVTPSSFTANTTNFTNSSYHHKLARPMASPKKLSSNNTATKKSPNSGLVSLSRRKLVRLKRNTNASVSVIANTLSSSTPLKKRLSSGLKKTKISPKNKNRLMKVNNMKLIRTTDTHWYKKVNKIVPEPTYKKNVMVNNIGNNKNIALVDIRGVKFKKTGNKIVRNSPTNTVAVKRQRASVLNRNGEFITSKGGKTLLKVDSNIKKVNTSAKIDVSTISSISPVKSYKSNASNKVKRRSLQILRNKMRKNNQPCLLFQKYGYCNNQIEGTCPKVHDKKQVAVCKNFLQGKCLLNNCLLSHDVGPEKMPTCKFFLEGYCTREGCPYLHVKVSSKNPICVEFLRGYCSKGNECQKRHIYACPEFDRTGACSKGKSCPYPHKSHLTKTQRPRGGSRRKSVTPAKSLENLPSTSEVVKTGTRYYDLDPACDRGTEDLSKVRVRLLKQVKIMSGEPLDSSQVNDSSANTSVDAQSNDSAKSEEEPLKVCNRRKPMGPADPFIPIT